MDTKIKFIARLLVLTLFSTFMGCNEELYNIKEQDNTTDKNKISLAQFKNETNISGIEPILSVPTKTFLSSKTKSQLSDFVIDTLVIKRHISTNNKTTYTFRIYPLFTVAQPNEIYNLVYRKVNNTWRTSIFYLMKLPKENSEHKLFEKIEIVYDSESKTSLNSKIAPNQLCAYEIILIKCNGSCGNKPCDGTSCPTGECFTRIVAYVPCGEEPSGGSGVSLPYTGSSGGGGGGITDPYLFETNIYDNPDLSDPNFINILKRGDVWANLGYEGQDFFAKAENIGFFNETIQYQMDNNWSPKSYEFANWAREFKFGNPDVTWAQFKNWFMGNSEGIDGIYDAAFWDNPNLTFPTQSLPSWANFEASFPKDSNPLYNTPEKMYNSIGGTIATFYTGPNTNTCAIRLSKALNYSGVIIPNIPGQTYSGADGKFILNLLIK